MGGSGTENWGVGNCSFLHHTLLQSTLCIKSLIGSHLFLFNLGGKELQTADASAKVLLSMLPQGTSASPRAEIRTPGAVLLVRYMHRLAGTGRRIDRLIDGTDGSMQCGFVDKHRADSKLIQP